MESNDEYEIDDVYSMLEGDKYPEPATFDENDLRDRKLKLDW